MGIWEEKFLVRADMLFLLGVRGGGAETGVTAASQAGCICSAAISPFASSAFPSSPDTCGLWPLPVPAVSQLQGEVSKDIFDKCLHYWFLEHGGQPSHS